MVERDAGTAIGYNRKWVTPILANWYCTVIVHFVFVLWKRKLAIVDQGQDLVDRLLGYCRKVCMTACVGAGALHWCSHIGRQSQPAALAGVAPKTIWHTWACLPLPMPKHQWHKGSLMAAVYAAL